METLQARGALIVRRLEVNVSSQSPPRYAYILVHWLLIERSVPPDTRSSETVMLWPLLHVILDPSHPPSCKSYVDTLETRLEKMEGMLSRVCPYHLRPAASSLMLIDPAVSGRRLLARNGARRMGP